MKVLTVVGARPQFIKAAPVSRAIRQARHAEFLVHTGQHYDYQMSQVFFDQLGIPEPDVNLEVGSGLHGKQTGQMLMLLEEVMIAQNPDCVLVYGDTNSTLAGAVAAIKLQIPLAHIEAGLRSFNRQMPEEHNRVLTDHCSDLLFCPTWIAVENLRLEGIVNGVYQVGDTMYDATLQFADLARHRSRILEKLKLEKKSYLLATVHRAYNTDNQENLRELLTAFSELEKPVLFPVHPRTRQKIAELSGASNLKLNNNLRMIDPVGYLDMLMLEQNARLILTDSGGVQKEAYFFNVPCVTLRSETEWVETVNEGWNVVSGVSLKNILEAVRSMLYLEGTNRPLFGDGQASVKIRQVLEQYKNVH